jgi:hypothetical protein
LERRDTLVQEDKRGLRMRRHSVGGTVVLAALLLTGCDSHPSQDYVNGHQMYNINWKPYVLSGDVYYQSQWWICYADTDQAGHKTGDWLCTEDDSYQGPGR